MPQQGGDHDPQRGRYDQADEDEENRLSIARPSVVSMLAAAVFAICSLL
jgi:hypothetical protein